MVNPLTNTVTRATLYLKEVRMTGTEIKAFRKRFNMTQQELADKLGVDRVTVARWETNSKRPSNLAKRQISRLLKSK